MRRGGVTLGVEVLHMLRRLLVPLAITLVAPVLGCSGAVATEPPATADTATTRAPVAQSAHGPLKVLGDALGDVPLTASQRGVIEKMATDAEARHAGAQSARRELVLAVAAQIEAGKIDRAALQPKIDALVAAMQTVQPTDRAAFEQLHAILTPDQRTAFVDAVEARAAGRAAQMRDKHPLAQWAADLGLSEEQRAQIKDAMKGRWQAAGHQRPGDAGAGAQERGAKLMNAFKQDRFVMDEAAPPLDLAQHAQKASERMLGLADASLGVLTPPQRALAAQKLRDRAESMDEVSPGMP
jgi:Spy/CpxP family protein refolding chaperone